MKRFLTDETAASLVEYALLLSLVTVVSIVVLTALGTAVNGMFSNVATAIQAASKVPTSPGNN